MKSLWNNREFPEEMWNLWHRANTIEERMTYQKPPEISSSPPSRKENVDHQPPHTKQLQSYFRFRIVQGKGEVWDVVTITTSHNVTSTYGMSNDCQPTYSRWGNALRMSPEDVVASSRFLSVERQQTLPYSPFPVSWCRFASLWNNLKIFAYI